MKRSRVGALLAREARGDRIATSLKLDGGVLAGCKSFCEARGLTISELVEALIDDFLGERKLAGDALKSVADIPKRRYEPRRTTNADISR